MRWNLKEEKRVKTEKGQRSTGWRRDDEDSE
jgi:hypothetical protein